MNKAMKILGVLGLIAGLSGNAFAGSVIGNALLSPFENVAGSYKLHVPDTWKKLQSGTKLSVIEPITLAATTQPTLVHVSTAEDRTIESLQQLEARLSASGAWTQVRVGSLYGYMQVKSAQTSIRLLRAPGSILSVELTHRSAQDREELLARIIQTLHSTK